MTRILLVRHGQSEWNATGRWQGWADPPLTDVGRAQARSAAGGVGSIDAVVASDLQRAMETAVIIADALGVGPAAIDPGLRERDVGEWTGLTRAEIEERWPDLLHAFFRRSGGPGGTGSERPTGPVDPPGGETAPQIIERVLSAVARIVDAYEGADVLAVAHGGVIRMLERHLGVDPAQLPNLGGVELLVQDGRMSVGPRLLLVDPDEVAITIPRQL
ncbi:MAG TPA: histidine phosphatase family protein [Acidimicrobiales bacterium]|nr:histidine phosphatase family protein [Acidimicrobiales bacterium]